MKKYFGKLCITWIVALACLLCTTSLWAAATIGTNAEFLITNTIETYQIPLTANSKGWLILHKPEWLKISPQPVDVDTVFVNGAYYVLYGQQVENAVVKTMPMLPAVSQIFIKLDGALIPDSNSDSGEEEESNPVLITDSDSLILQNLDSGNIWSASVKALFDNGQEKTEATRIVVHTNTADHLPIKLHVNTGEVGKYYVFFEHPQLLPGQKYAYTREGKLTLFSNYGFPVQNAEDLYYADGVDIISLNIGNIPMAGLEGTLIARISRATVSEMVTAYEVFYDVNSLSGDWIVTDVYDGSASKYSVQIHEGLGLFSGNWDGHPFIGEYTQDGYYRIIFNDGRYQYQYVVRGLNDTSMSGEWSYSGEPDKVFVFSGQKRSETSFFPVAHPVVGSWQFKSRESSCCCPLPGLFKDTVVISQNGSQLTLKLDQADLTGTIDGNSLLFGGSFVHNSGTVSVKASATLMEGGGKLYGTGRWTYSSEDGVCTGTIQFGATRE